MAKFSRTIGPLHFEDLEPHKFEDLVRGLLYDFRDWQSIEATGRKGSDEGFDVRAWEKTKTIVNEDEEENTEGEHPMAGNLWMIQCKREKQLGPKRIKEILDDIDKKNYPYGYILAAPTDFSKKSYDLFRETLLKMGVMEFYLWGKAQLEDMLYMPKNDHILFATFGISFNTRRRSKVSEIKFGLINKNKLFQSIGGQDGGSIHESILVRDFNDENYPYKSEYKDFDQNPKWQEHIVVQQHPLGLLIDARECFAYFDEKKKEFDFTRAVDLINRQSDFDNDWDLRKKENELREKVADFWEHLPRKNQIKLHFYGLLSFQDMLIIDNKGDSHFKFPHIFVEYTKRLGPFRWVLYILKSNSKEINLDREGYKRVKIFPKVFPKPIQGKIHFKDAPLELDALTFSRVRYSHEGGFYLFDVDQKYKSVKTKNLIAIKNQKENGVSSSDPDVLYLEVTYSYETTTDKYLEENDKSFLETIQRQVGREVKSDEKLRVLEVLQRYLPVKETA